MLDYEQQARELVEMMKNHPLNSEQIKEMVSPTIGFVKSFVEVVKQEIQDRKERNAEVVKALELSISTLEEFIKEGDVSDEVKNNAINRITEIAVLIAKLGQQQDENSKEIIKWAIVGGVTILLTLFGIKKQDLPISLNIPRHF